MNTTIRLNCNTVKKIKYGWNEAHGNYIRIWTADFRDIVLKNLANEKISLVLMRILKDQVSEDVMEDYLCDLGRNTFNQEPILSPMQRKFHHWLQNKKLIYTEVDCARVKNIVSDPYWLRTTIWITTDEIELVIENIQHKTEKITIAFMRFLSFNLSDKARINFISDLTQIMAIVKTEPGQIHQPMIPRTEEILFFNTESQVETLEAVEIIKQPLPKNITNSKYHSYNTRRKHR